MGESGQRPPRDAMLNAIRSRRVEERLLHLSFYLDEPPERSILLGLELSEAARRAREASLDH